MLSSSGVYTIENIQNGHRYDGSAVNVGKRLARHLKALRSGRHGNRHLQNAFLKYGEGAFSFRPLFYCDKKDLILFEQRAIDFHKPEYNISPTAGSNLGGKFGARPRMVLAAMGNKWASGTRRSPETRARMAAAQQAIRDKMSDLKKGRVVSPETRRKTAKTLAGHEVSVVTRKKISGSLKGKPWSEARRIAYERRKRA